MIETNGVSVSLMGFSITGDGGSSFPDYDDGIHVAGAILKLIRAFSLFQLSVFIEKNGIDYFSRKWSPKGLSRIDFPDPRKQIAIIHLAEPL